MKSRILLPGQTPPPRPQNTMTSASLFQEIDDAITQERFMSVWRRFGILIIAALILAVAAVAVQQGLAYIHSRHTQSMTTLMAAELNPALQGDEAQKTDLTALARTPFEQFFAYGLEQDAEKKARLEKKLVDSSATPALIRDTVRLTEIQRTIATPDAQTDRLLSELQAMIDSGSPLSDIARLEAAVLAAASGDAARAIDLLSPLTENDTGSEAHPSPLRREALLLHALFTSDNYRKEYGE